MDGNRAQNVKSCKTYVDVGVDFSKDGRMLPRWVQWKDGRRFVIDRVKDCRRAASLKAGGAGLRYTVSICGKETYLFYEENYRWFVEARE